MPIGIGTGAGIRLSLRMARNRMATSLVGRDLVAHRERQSSDEGRIGTRRLDLPIIITGSRRAAPSRSGIKAPASHNALVECSRTVSVAISRPV
jgi:hypothetical protein